MPALQVPGAFVGVTWDSFQILCSFFLPLNSLPLQSPTVQEKFPFPLEDILIRPATASGMSMQGVSLFAL